VTGLGVVGGTHPLTQARRSARKLYVSDSDDFDVDLLNRQAGPIIS
jgi:tRNA A37 threonylcarbamoyladenosine dehydratase